LTAVPRAASEDIRSGGGNGRFSRNLETRILGVQDSLRERWFLFDFSGLAEEFGMAVRWTDQPQSDGPSVGGQARCD
jgi:hypothetical protein